MENWFSYNRNQQKKLPFKSKDVESDEATTWSSDDSILFIEETSSSSNCFSAEISDDKLINSIADSLSSGNNADIPTVVQPDEAESAIDLSQVSIFIVYGCFRIIKSNRPV